MALRIVRRIERRARLKAARCFSVSTQEKPLSQDERKTTRIQRKPHIPVMVEEVLKYLEPSPGETFVDMTFGAGGHSARILDHAPDTKIFALDRDPVAYEHAKLMAEKYPGRLVPLLGRFSELPQLLRQHKVQANSIDGFLFDFGCSSMQFDVANRGFSLARNGPLDMRMDGGRCPEQPTAAEVLARASEEDLYRILKVYGEEKQAKKIARAIIEARYTFKNLETTDELAKLVESTLDDESFILDDYDENGVNRTDKLGRTAHLATKTFQAFRIFVNNELNEINYGVVIAQNYLKISGRLITLAFHSLEDTIVKRHLFGNINDNMINRSPLKYCNYNKFYDKMEIENLIEVPWAMLHKHVLIPKADEIDANPRARSAKFRALIKVK